MCPRPSCGGGESGRVEGVKLNESMAGGGGRRVDLELSMSCCWP